MASMRDIKRRRSSIQSTQQITKAMKLVSTVKLQRARTAAERSKPYFACMYRTVQNILSKTGHIEHKYLQDGTSAGKAVIVITSDKGLAGGYNSNMIKLITRHEEWRKEDVRIYAIGSKGRDDLARRGYRICEDLSPIPEEPDYRTAMQLTESLLQSFEEGVIGEIYLCYTAFQSTVSHVPLLRKLLPVDMTELVKATDKREEAPISFEPDEEAVLDMLIPKYVAGLLYGGMVEAAASENAARMQAMDNAMNNAEEMVNDLTLMYNRARQGSITQELTEIIAGAEALV